MGTLSLVYSSIFIFLVVILLAISTHEKNRSKKEKAQLQEFLKSRGYTVEVKVQTSTALTFKDGPGNDDIYFLLIVDFQAMSIRGSATKETAVGQGIFVYEFDQYCLVEDINDKDNSSLRLYRKPYNKFEEPS